MVEQLPSNSIKIISEARVRVILFLTESAYFSEKKMTGYLSLKIIYNF